MARIPGVLGSPYDMDRDFSRRTVDCELRSRKRLSSVMYFGEELNLRGRNAGDPLAPSELLSRSRTFCEQIRAKRNIFTPTSFSQVSRAIDTSHLQHHILEG